MCGDSKESSFYPADPTTSALHYRCLCPVLGYTGRTNMRLLLGECGSLHLPNHSYIRKNVSKRLLWETPEWDETTKELLSWKTKEGRNFPLLISPESVAALWAAMRGTWEHACVSWRWVLLLHGTVVFARAVFSLTSYSSESWHHFLSYRQVIII
jgi:hypothetical protein